MHRALLYGMQRCTDSQSSARKSVDHFHARRETTPRNRRMYVYSHVFPHIQFASNHEYLFLAHKSRKKVAAQSSLSRVPPSFDEAQALHNVYLSGLQHSEQDTDEKVWMSATKLEKTMLMFPQERKYVYLYCLLDPSLIRE